jgi:hypothetical protein
LYINDGHSLALATPDINSIFDSLGMVTSAIWSDYDNDADADLIVVGEWMSITLIRNDGGKLVFDSSVKGLGATEGWWNSITGGDFDSDGDIDYLLGNYGLNSDYTASAEFPIRLHSGYLDANRSWDILITRPMETLKGETHMVPVHSRNQLLDQFNILKKQFTSFESYALATEEDLFYSESLSRDNLSECRALGSVYLENLQNGSFKLSLLPRLAQIAPIHDIEVADINMDGNLDALLAMNFYGNDVYRGRADASIGVCLIGDGKGGFEAILPSQSGYFLDGDARAITQYDNADGSRIMVATRNNDSASAFTLVGSERLERYQPGTSEQSIVVKLSNGDERKIEFYYSSGYLSQSTRSTILPAGGSLINNIDHEY